MMARETAINNKTISKSNSKRMSEDWEVTVMSAAIWEKMPLSQPTMNAIKKIDFRDSSQIDTRVIQQLLDGKDVVGAAPTGYEKTLSFLIPVVELLHGFKDKYKEEKIAIILCPTKKLVFETHGVARRLLAGHLLRLQILTGGVDAEREAFALEGGPNIVVATPDWLLINLQRNRVFIKDHLKKIVCLVIDEAHRIFTDYKIQMELISDILPRDGRQTAIFSHTLSRKVVDLAELWCRKEHEFIV